MVSKTLFSLALLLGVATAAPACDYGFSIVTPQVGQVQAFGYFAPPLGTFGYVGAAPLLYAAPAYAIPAPLTFGFNGYGAGFGGVGFNRAIVGRRLAFNRFGRVIIR